MSDKEEEAMATAEARAIAREQAFSLPRALATLDRLDITDGRFLAALKRHRDEAIPALRGAMKERSGLARLKASCLLLALGEADGTSGLADALNGGDLATCRQALLLLSSLPWDGDKGGYQVPLDKAAVFSAVDLLLDTAGPELRALAVQVLERLGTENADRRVAALIADADPEIRLSVARWLALRGEDGGALAVVEELLFRPGLDRHDAYWLTSALRDLAERGAPDARRNACRLAMKYLRAHLDDNDNHVANHASFCLEAIAAVAPVDERELLSEIIGSNLQGWLRGSALNRLAEIEGAEGVERLCDALADKDLREQAAKGLTKLARGSRDPRMLEALAAALDDARGEQVIAAVIEAIMAVGGAPSAILERAMARADPDDAMSLHWLLNDIGPRHLAERLAAAGAIAMPGKRKMAEYQAQWNEDRRAPSILWDMLGTAGRLTGFDCDTGEAPADHASLVQRLGEITGGILALEDVSQTVEPEPDGDCKVRFVCNGRGYSFIARNLGCYYDLRSVLDNLNGILASFGRKERFFQLYNPGTIGIVACAPEEQFVAMARDLRIPLQLDPDAARRAGIAYADYVRSILT